MTGTVRTQIFTSFALTMFDCLYCTEKKEKKKVWVSMKLFFFCWNIFSFSLGGFIPSLEIVSHTISFASFPSFILIFFFLVRFVLFCFFFLPVSTGARFHPGYPQEDYVFFFSVVGRVANVRETKRIRRCVLSVLANAHHQPIWYMCRVSWLLL